MDMHQSIIQDRGEFRREGETISGWDRNVQDITYNSGKGTVTWSSRSGSQIAIEYQLYAGLGDMGCGTQYLLSVDDAALRQVISAAIPTIARMDVEQRALAIQELLRPFHAVFGNGLSSEPFSAISLAKSFGE